MVFGHGLGSAEIDLVKAMGGIPHNEYMRVLYELGVVGLFLFIASFYQLWRLPRQLSLTKKSRLSRLIGDCCLGILILYMSGALVDNMLNKYKNMGAPLFAFMAFAVIRLRDSDDESEALPNLTVNHANNRILLVKSHKL